MVLRNRFQHSVVTLLLILAVGGHWAFLQAVAWTGMMIRFSQTDSVPVAISKTFDGKHPCGLCKVVKEAKHNETEHKRQFSKTDFKFNWMLASEMPLLWMPTDFVLLPNSDQNSDLLFDSPPIPPPRVS